MKKFLLSSIIMLGVCGAVSAQNETGSKFKKNNTATTSAAPTPQKAAIMSTSDVAAPADTRTDADKAAAAAAPSSTQSKAQMKAAQAQAAAAVNVDAAGVVVPAAETKSKTTGTNEKKNHQ
jgi:hypothetical protein